MTKRITNAANAELIMLQPGPHRRVLLGTQATLGVGLSCDIRLPDPSLAPLHATVTRIGDDWYLRSHQSAAPCQVNGRTMHEGRLTDRDVIEMGDLLIGFRLLPALAPMEHSADPAARSLAWLREDVADERAALGEERGLWEAELERRRGDLVTRDSAFRNRASRTARALERERERQRRKQLHLDRRAAELERIAGKLQEQRRLMDYERQETQVRQRHLDDYFRTIEMKRLALESATEEEIRTREARQMELHDLNIEIESRRAELDRVKRAPDDAPAGVALVYRELMLEAREREAAAEVAELETVAKQADDLLARLERQASAWTAFVRRIPSGLTNRQSVPLVASEEPMEAVSEDREAIAMWADNFSEQYRVAGWWRGLMEEWKREIRTWRAEKSHLFAELHLQRERLAARERRLFEERGRTAREMAREKQALAIERETLDRRRAWVDRGQQRHASLQARSLEMRLGSRVDRVDVAEALQQLADLTELWNQFRCDVVRERLELTCERGHWILKSKELSRLRKLANKQRSLLASLVAEHRLAEQLWRLERDRQTAVSAERERAVENLAGALVETESVVGEVFTSASQTSAAKPQAWQLSPAIHTAQNSPQTAIAINRTGSTQNLDKPHTAATLETTDSTELPDLAQPPKSIRIHRAA